MSTTGILAKGMAGALKGGDVLAQGKTEEREMMWWYHKTEVARKANLESMQFRHNLEADTGWRSKEGGAVNKYDLNRYRNEARKKGVSVDQYMKDQGYSPAAEYSETSKRDAVLAGAERDLDQKLKTKKWRDLGLSPQEEKDFREAFKNSAVERLTAQGKGLTADQFLSHYTRIRESLIDPEKGGRPMEEWEAEAKMNNMDVQSYISQRAMQATQDAAVNYENMSSSISDRTFKTATVSRTRDEISKAVRISDYAAPKDIQRKAQQLRFEYQQYPDIIAMINEEEQKALSQHSLLTSGEPTEAERKASIKEDKKRDWEERKSKMSVLDRQLVEAP